jgi:hypothetical protein
MLNLCLELSRERSAQVRSVLGAHGPEVPDLSARASVAVAETA